MLSGLMRYFIKEDFQFAGPLQMITQPGVNGDPEQVVDEFNQPEYM